MPPVVAGSRTPQATGPSPHATYRLVQDFLRPYRKSSRRAYELRFREFACHLGMSPEAWTTALAKLLAMGEEEGRRTLSAYALSLSDPHTSCQRNRSGKGFLAFTRFARRRGLITWSAPLHGLNRGGGMFGECAPELAALVAEWSRELLLRNYSPKTVRRYGRAVLSLGGYLRHSGNAYQELENRTFTAWAEELARQGFGNTYILGGLWRARQFYGWLESRGLVRKVPRLLISLRRNRRGRSDFLTEREMIRVIGAAESLRDRALVEVLYATGCRRGEVLGLDLADLSFEAKKVRCRGKCGPRVAFLNHPSIQAVEAYLPLRARWLEGTERRREQALFLSQWGRRLSHPQSCVILKDLGRRAGLEKTLTAQLIRRSFATHLVNRGADLRVVQALLGHSRIDETARYAELLPRRLFGVYRKCAPKF